MSPKATRASFCMIMCSLVAMVTKCLTPPPCMTVRTTPCLETKSESEIWKKFLRCRLQRHCRILHWHVSTKQATNEKTFTSHLVSVYVTFLWRFDSMTDNMRVVWERSVLTFDLLCRMRADNSRLDSPITPAWSLASHHSTKRSTSFVFVPSCSAASAATHTYTSEYTLHLKSTEEISGSFIVSVKAYSQQ